jgi:hypothetical protein
VVVGWIVANIVVGCTVGSVLVGAVGPVGEVGGAITTTEDSVGEEDVTIVVEGTLGT